MKGAKWFLRILGLSPLVFLCITFCSFSIDECAKAVDNGGGIYVSSGTSFTLTEGSISGRTVTENGGAVYNEGNFYMEGGTISRNSAVTGSAIYSKSGNLTLGGGNIEYNTSTTTTNAESACVYFCGNGTLNCSGTNITSNTNNFAILMAEGSSTLNYSNSYIDELKNGIIFYGSTSASSPQTMNFNSGSIVSEGNYCLYATDESKYVTINYNGGTVVQNNGARFAVYIKSSRHVFNYTSGNIVGTICFISSSTYGEPYITLKANPENQINIQLRSLKVGYKVAKIEGTATDSALDLINVVNLPSDMRLKIETINGEKWIVTADNLITIDFRLQGGGAQYAQLSQTSVSVQKGTSYSISGLVTTIGSTKVTLSTTNQSVMPGTLLNTMLKMSLSSSGSQMASSGTFSSNTTIYYTIETPSKLTIKVNDKNLGYLGVDGYANMVNYLIKTNEGITGVKDALVGEIVVPICYGTRVEITPNSYGGAVINVQYPYGNRLQFGTVSNSFAHECIIYGYDREKADEVRITGQNEAGLTYVEGEDRTNQLFYAMFQGPYYSTARRTFQIIVPTNMVDEGAINLNDRPELELIDEAHMRLTYDLERLGISSSDTNPYFRVIKDNADVRYESNRLLIGFYRDYSDISTSYLSYIDLINPDRIPAVYTGRVFYLDHQEGPLGDDDGNGGTCVKLKSIDASNRIGPSVLSVDIQQKGKVRIGVVQPGTLAENACNIIGCTLYDFYVLGIPFVASIDYYASIRPNDLAIIAKEKVEYVELTVNDPVVWLDMLNMNELHMLVSNQFYVSRSDVGMPAPSESNAVMNLFQEYYASSEIGDIKNFFLDSSLRSRYHIDSFTVGPTGEAYVIGANNNPLNGSFFYSPSEVLNKKGQLLMSYPTPSDSRQSSAVYDFLRYISNKVTLNYEYSNFDSLVESGTFRDDYIVLSQPAHIMNSKLYNWLRINFTNSNGAYNIAPIYSLLNFVRLAIPDYKYDVIPYSEENMRTLVRLLGFGDHVMLFSPKIMEGQGGGYDYDFQALSQIFKLVKEKGLANTNLIEFLREHPEFSIRMSRLRRPAPSGTDFESFAIIGPLAQRQTFMQAPNWFGSQATTNSMLSFIDYKKYYLRPVKKTA